MVTPESIRASIEANRVELGNLRLSLEEEAAIVAFLRTLSDGFTTSGGRESR